MGLKITLPRIVLILYALIPLLYLEEFYFYSLAVFTGTFELITQEWVVTAFFIALFVAFLIPLSYRRKTKWVEKGLVGAFFVSLFFEMYGIPLTILFASKYLANPSLPIPPMLFSVDFLGVSFAFHFPMLYASVFMIVGAALVILGWVTLYQNIKNKGLVTTGIYAFSRHPQYLGFLLVIYGWLVAWPTLPTLIFAPILLYKYTRVSQKEEQEVAKEFPDYEQYKKKVPFFI